MVPTMFRQRDIACPFNVLVSIIMAAETICGISPGQESLVPGELANTMDGAELIVEPRESFVKVTWY